MASILAFSSVVGAAGAQDLCADINYLIDQSHTRFADIMDTSGGDGGGRAVTLTLAGASSCHVLTTLEGHAYHCSWAFSYRTKNAYDTFDALVGEVDTCIGPQATLHEDQSVNHPDFYALRRYEMDQADVSVSVKDKSAQDRTFVFIRVQGR